MRVLVATVKTPFIYGGAESLAADLVDAINAAGHEADLFVMPFRFHPPGEVLRSMEYWKGENLNGFGIDRVICMKFPAYCCDHPGKVIWLLHQHRAVYDLWGFDSESRTEELHRLRESILHEDARVFRLHSTLFTISQTVSGRLHRTVGAKSRVLYPPSKLAGKLYSAQAEPFILFPSRLEEHKRQRLLLQAMAKVRSNVSAFITGEGGLRMELERLVSGLGLSKRVLILGEVPEDELIALYAHCLGVFFGPLDEDYGFVTAEAMLASKPVITCLDSGGPVELVVDGATGRIVPPEPGAIAEAIDELYANRSYASEMGKAGYDRIQKMDISWARVTHELLAV